jgi:hypothetical protein
VRAEDDSVVLRLLSQRRDELTGERTRTANRLHALLRDLIPGAKRILTAAQAGGLLGGVHPVTAADVQRKQLCREVVADLRRKHSCGGPAAVVPEHRTPRAPCSPRWRRGGVRADAANRGKADGISRRMVEALGRTTLVQDVLADLARGDR